MTKENKSFLTSSSEKWKAEGPKAHTSDQGVHWWHVVSFYQPCNFPRPAGQRDSKKLMDKSDEHWLVQWEESSGKKKRAVFTYSFTKWKITECLLCARHCSRGQKPSERQVTQAYPEVKEKEALRTKAAAGRESWLYWGRHIVQHDTIMKDE